MSVSKTENETDEELRGWFGTLYNKFEKMQGLMDYEQDDPNDFLVIVDDLQEIINRIKDFFEAKYYLVPSVASPPHEDAEKTEKRNKQFSCTYHKDLSLHYK